MTDLLSELERAIQELWVKRPYLIKLSRPMNRRINQHIWSISGRRGAVWDDNKVQHTLFNIPVEVVDDNADIAILIKEAL